MELTDDDLLTIELRVQKEEVLDRTTALRLIEEIRQLQIECENLAPDVSAVRLRNEYDVGYDEGFADGAASVRLGGAL